MTTTNVPLELLDWARLPGPARVLAAVRRRGERGYDTESGTLRLPLDDDARRQIGRVLGIRWELSGRKIRLQDLADALSHHGLTIRQLVESVDGRPVVNLRAARALAVSAAEAERNEVAGLLSSAGISADAGRIWLRDPSLPRSGEGELRTFVDQVIRIWERLPGPGGGVSLSQLAATTSENNAHALDYDEPLGRAVARLIAVQHDLPRPLRPNRDWRATWASVGVTCDGVSSRVLALNLPLTGPAAVARLCRAASGEPVWLTLRSLAGDWTASHGGTVFVCENVTVLESAGDRLGPRCPPMVATDGFPTAAGIDLLSGLALAGCDIRVRADFDHSGFDIVDQIRSAVPAGSGWRFDAASYAAHLELSGNQVPASSLEGDLGQLRMLHAEVGVDVHEESMLDLLLEDLADGAKR